MDQNAFDLDLDFQLDCETDRADRPAAPTATRRRTATLTNSPGCAPAVLARSEDRAALARRSSMRRVEVAGWASPAAASWARPSRTLRKVALRAVDAEMNEPA